MSTAPVGSGQDIASKKADLFLLEKGIFLNEHDLKAVGKVI